MNSAESYVRHPNSYLPTYNIHSETDGESIPLNHSSSEMIASSKVLLKNGNGGMSATLNSDEDDDDDVQAYGFPVKRRNRVQHRDVLADRGGLYIAL